MSSTLQYNPRRVLSAVAAALLTGGVLTACGSSDDASSEAGASDGGLTAVTAERSGGGQFQSAILAQRLGYFEV